METATAVKILEDHNKWRRGDDDMEMADPKQLGEAIDFILSQFKQKQPTVTEETDVSKMENTEAKGLTEAPAVDQKKIAEKAYYQGFNDRHYPSVHPDQFKTVTDVEGCTNYLNKEYPL